MGTRNLTAVVLEGRFRIAQYGQWDGHPEGQGATALAFLHSMDRSVFEAKLRAARFATQADCDRINAELSAQKIGDNLLAAGGKYQQISRDRGATILQIVQDAEPGIVLLDRHAFAADSLFCEWAYVIDLDQNTFEVYKGFNRAPLPAGERFQDAKSSDASEGYFPVKHVRTFDLAALPDEAEFLASFQSQDASEEVEA